MNNTKEVNFYEWCERCKWSDLDETEEPCRDCLELPWNIDSHKPHFYKEPDNV